MRDEPPHPPTASRQDKRSRVGPKLMYESVDQHCAIGNHTKMPMTLTKMTTPHNCAIY